VPGAGLNDNVNTIRNREVKLSNGTEDRNQFWSKGMPIKQASAKIISFG
jgi:hypothetical protein